MGKVKVPKGSVIVQKEDGRGYVPFLISVRDEDIIWGKLNPPIENVIDKFLSESSGEMNAIYPGKRYRIESDGWTCEINSDGSAIATKKIVIDSTFSFSDDTHKCLRSTDIPLPVLFLYGREFNIQVTKCSYNNQISCSAINVPLGGTTLWECIGTDGNMRTYTGYKSIITEIHSPVDRFSDTIINDANGSYLFVMIKGFIPVI